jgi:GntR family transcriptional regulator, N-acetylglucosamine utilization regulator
VLDKTSSTPLHLQLTALLRQRIISNELEADSRLPSEREMCDQFGISRITVRKAMAALQNEGLIYTTVGKGTYVAVQKLKEELRPLSSFTEDLERRGLVASSQVLAAEIVGADDDLVGKLRLAKDSEVVHIHRLRLASGSPVAIQTTWLPHRRCPGILEYDLTTRSLFDILRGEYGLALAHADTDITATLARFEECRLLSVVPPAAVLVCDQTTYLDNDEVIEFVHSVFQGDKYTLHTRQ